MWKANRKPLVHLKRRANVLVGCLVAAITAILIGGVLAYLVATSWKGWVASGVNKTMQEAINRADIPPDEKPEMISHINEYTAAFEAGQLSFEQIARAFDMLVESPLIPVGMVYTVEEGYLKPSGLDEEERNGGTRALQRVARGLHDKTINPNALKEVFEPIGYTDSEGRFRLNVKSAVNDDMMRRVIANAAAKADEHAIPDEPYVMDLSDELKRLLDESRAPPPPGG